MNSFSFLKQTKWLLLLLIFASLCALLRMRQMPNAPNFAAPNLSILRSENSASKSALKEKLTPKLTPKQFVTKSAGLHRHAASLVELSNAKLAAFWFSGSREGGSDVTIQMAYLDAQSGQWSDEKTVVTREHTQQGLHRFVKKIGNPVAFFDDKKNELHLFYVTVSVGGWAGSSITHILSKDQGKTWRDPKRLITSPFLNLSTLVKSAPFLYQDGTLGLPVYHEFIGKFAEILRLDETMKVIDKTRLTSGKTTLQPSLLIQNDVKAMALLRYSGKAPNNVMAVSTTDAGKTWGKMFALPLKNPNAAVSGLVLADESLLIALNDQENNRDTLSLVASNDQGKSFYTLEMLENGKITAPENNKENKHEKENSEFSYPYLIRTKNGQIHLVYTWNRQQIAHRVLDENALMTQIAAPKVEKTAAK